MMAYGITAAGKTYTIEGTKTQPGVMPRALKDLFSGLDNNNNNTQEDIRVKVSLCEVYNEQIYDLLLSEGGGGDGGTGIISARGGGGGEHQRPALKLKEDAAGRVIVAGLKEVVVHNVDEALMVLRRGSKQRQRAGTGLNYASSRSHSIFTVTLYQPVYEKKEKGKKVEVGGADKEEEVEKVGGVTDRNNNNHQVVIEEQRLGRIAFVDLAGSERAQRTGNVGVRLKESVAINSSLMTLGRCLEALRWNQKCHKEVNGGDNGNALPLKVVPYRESKVTHLFRDALHGWGRVILSVNVSPVAADYDETSHVLKYAALATQIGTLQTGEAPSRRGTKVNKTPMVLKRKAGGGNDDGGDENNKNKKVKAERQGSVPLTGQSQNVTDIMSQQQQVEKVNEVEEEEEEEDSYVQHDVIRQVSAEVEEEEEEVFQQGQGRVDDREEEVSFTLNRRSLSTLSEPGGEFCPITSTTPLLIVHNDDDLGGGGGGGDAAIHQAATTTPQSNAVTPVAVAGDGDLEFIDEEDVAALQARVQQLITQLQAAEEKCVLIESEVRAEVAEEMSALLKDMEANYKERLMMSNGGNNSIEGRVPMSQVKAAAKVMEEEEEMECDSGSASEGSPSSSPSSSAITTDNEEEEEDSDDPEEEEERVAMRLKIDLSQAKERISELESQLEQLIECNTALQQELEEANNDGTRLYNEYQALQKQLEEAKENVTQVEANTTMEQELIENQLDREKKNNAMLQERLNAAMGALAAIGSPSTTIMQKLAAAQGNNNNNGGGGFRNGGGDNNMNMNGGMEPGHTPHDIALMRARRAAAAEEEQHQSLQQQLLNSAGPPHSTDGGGGGGHSMPPLSLPPPGTAYGNRPSRFASQQQQPQQQAAGDDGDVPLSLLPPSILTNKNNDIEDDKGEKEKERKEEAEAELDDVEEEEEKERLTSEQKRRSSNRRTTTTTTTISSIIEALDAAATTSSPPSHDDHVDDEEEKEEEDDDAEKEEAKIKKVMEEEAVPVPEASPLSSPAPAIMYDDDDDSDIEFPPCQDRVEEEASITISSDAEGMEVDEEEGMSPIIGQPDQYKEEEEEDKESPASDEEEEEESEDSFDEDDSEEEDEEEEEEEEWAPSDEEDEEEEEEEEKEIDDLVPTGIMKKNPKSRVEKGNSGGGVEMKQAGDRKRSKGKGGKRGDKLEEAFNDAAVVAQDTEHTTEKEKKKTTKRRLLNNPNSARMRNVLGDWNSMEEEGEDAISSGVRAVSAEASAQVAIANLRRSGRARG